MEALILPFEENVTTPDNFEGFEMVSFFDRSNRLNFANPNVFPCSVEYEYMGTGKTLNKPSAFWLNLSNFVLSFFGAVVSCCANARQVQSNRDTTRKYFTTIDE